MSLIFILYILFIKVIDFHLLSYFALDFCIDILHTYIYIYSIIIIGLMIRVPFMTPLNPNRPFRSWPRSLIGFRNLYGPKHHAIVMAMDMKMELISLLFKRNLSPLKGQGSMEHL